MPDIDITPLSSRFAAGDAAWRLEDRGDAVEVVPRLAIGYLMSVWAVGAFLYTTALLVFPRFGDVPGPLRYGFFFGIPVIIVLAHVLDYITYRNGVRFLIDRARSTFTLPSVQKTWPLANVVGWQIVNYKRGVARSNDDHYSQLIAVVQEGTAVARYLLFTGTGRGFARRFEELVEQVAAVTPLRLVSLVEDGVEKISAHA